MKTRSLGARDRIVVGFVLWTLVHTTEALAGETVPLASEAKQNANVPRQTIPMTAAMTRIPAPFQASDLTAPPVYSPREFRPRAHSATDSDVRATDNTEQSLMGNTTMWERLSDYRTHDRLSLVTLWETGGNSLSLQAGRRGGPTLQWTSRMSHSGASRGILDELFSTSVGGVGRNLHFPHTSGGTESPTKASKLLDAGTPGSATK